MPVRSWYLSFGTPATLFFFVLFDTSKKWGYVMHVISTKKVLESLNHTFAHTYFIYIEIHFFEGTAN